MTRDGTGLAVAGDFNVGNLSSTTQRWPRPAGVRTVFPRCAAASPNGRLDMEAWLVEDSLTVVSGAGRAVGDAVTRWPSTLERQNGMAATEVDYGVVNGTA